MNRRSPSQRGRTLPLPLPLPESAEAFVASVMVLLASAAAGAAGAAGVGAEAEEVAEVSFGWEPEYRRLPSWTSLPAGNMKRRSCQLLDDMVAKHKSSGDVLERWDTSRSGVE
ncbi:uncharacterized protein HMPREF1120_05792 [Exophiala dermatitidis NIH/UT8656]|uniref:Uncharacterized protein n=1 Tax=Exophiala dermatitidis (strain ATCC 34100 / CBS 525.76 / NIH/UT8656) TaxID=858893 RepID=H6C1N9_EXODN|nr:uncharacterized protein HMPREF1120_05792 [Exophiala dermatitidis NIH/UT8656]EHY57768.1 hypothetical protein HMPREF1120_05792 [Exophiala dermatitidis NIH/UT8656]